MISSTPTSLLSQLPATRRTCPLCSAELKLREPDHCPRCDWVSGYRRTQEETRHVGSGRDLVAACLSIVPGLGHFYKGQIGAGITALAGALAVLLFVAGTVVATVGVAVLLAPIYMVAVALHAYWAEDLAGVKTMARAVTAPARPVPEYHAPRL